MGAQSLNHSKWNGEIKRNRLDRIGERTFFHGVQSRDKISLALSMCPKIISIVREKSVF